MVGTVELAPMARSLICPIPCSAITFVVKPPLPNVPWASLDFNGQYDGENLAPGYAIDLNNRAYAGFNFAVQTYPGLKEICSKIPRHWTRNSRSAVGFIYHIMAAATPLTPAEFVAQQRSYALALRTRILADAQASVALKTLSAEPNAWATCS